MQDTGAITDLDAMLTEIEDLYYKKNIPGSLLSVAENEKNEEETLKNALEFIHKQEADIGKVQVESSSIKKFIFYY